MPGRRVTSALTIMVLCGLLAAGLVFGTKALFAPLPDDSPTATPACVTQQVGAGRRVTSRDVTVSVFNASNRTGLASRTLATLGNRGFQLGEASNAPEDVHVKFVQVFTTEKNDVAAKLVGLQFGKHTPVRRGEDLGPGIDIVVGHRFKGLVKAPRSVKTRSQQDVCVPVDE